jgi:hypothetical protein
MSTFTRVIPIGQLAVTRRELEQAGATGIDWKPVRDGYVEVTATMPDSGWKASRAVLHLFRPPF